MGKLEFVRQLTEKVNGIALAGGDTFHVKNPKSQANSYGLVNQLTRKFKEFPHGQVIGTIGNHDLLADQMASLRSQPLGLLIEAGVYHNLVAEPVVIDNGTIKVSIESFPYDTGEATLQRLLAEGAKNRGLGINYRIGIVHAFGEPGNGGSMFGELKIGYNQVQHLDYDFLLWGHDHSRKETVTVGNITHVNLGSLARAAFDYDEVNRKVVAMVLSFSNEGVKGKEVEIPVLPLEVVFTMADKEVETVGKSDDVSEFFMSMENQIDGIETNDPRKVLKSLCNDDPKLLALAIDLAEL